MYYIYIYIYIYIYTMIYNIIYIPWVLWVLLTLLRKKEYALITHSAMETWKYAIIRLSEISLFYLYALFRKFRTRLDSEPATPLYMEWLKQRNYMNFYRDQYFCFLDRDFDILNMTNGVKECLKLLIKTAYNGDASNTLAYKFTWIQAKQPS